jgi:glycosyltransferase involved in cell wall biosynthesis
MKLIFDCRFIRIDHHDGISRFSSDLFTALSKISAITALVSDERQLKWLPAKTDYILGNSPTNPLAELGLPRKLNKAGATHVFSPMQTMGAFGKKYKLVLTLHDLIYYSHPRAPASLPLHVRIAWRIYHLNFIAVRMLLNQADAVATVSTTSKGLIERKNLTKRPVHVIYNAPESLPNLEVAPGQSPRARTKKLVYMGSFMEYKNVETLIMGMKSLSEYELVLLSKISDKRWKQLRDIAGVASDQIRFSNGVSDQEYVDELSSAFALVSASKDEGFGIPLVEAMRYATPLVVSDIPIFREVAEDSAKYFDPTKPLDFVEKVRELEAAGEWEASSLKSAERASFYQWDKSAGILLNVLSKL